MIVQHEYRIKVSDVGKENKATNKAILAILEDVACIHSDIAGYGVTNIDETHVTWLLLEWKVQIIKRPKYGDKVIAKTWSKASKKCYAFRDFEVCNEKGEIIIRASSKWVLMDVEKCKIVTIQDEIMGKYEPELDLKSFEDEEFKKNREPEKCEMQTLYKVKKNDIDINNHMHNINYIDLANEILPEYICKKGELDYIRITYKKEIKLGETVICKFVHNEEKNSNIITIKSEDDKTLHAIIELT